MAKLSDIFSDDMTAAGGGDLNVLRLNDNPVLVTIFTDQIGDLETHYVSESSIGEVRCNKTREGRCLLCDIGNGATDKHLLPVYVVRDDEVQVLGITATKRGFSLGPQVMAEIRKGDLDRRYLRISRTGAKYTVTSVPAQEGSEMGEAVVKRFVEQLDAGGIELERAIPVYGNQQLLDVPEIERVATAMGFSRSVYVAPTDETA